MRTPMRRFSPLLFVLPALVPAGCALLDHVAYIGPYHRTPSGTWIECEGTCDTPEQLLPHAPGTDQDTGAASVSDPHTKINESSLQISPPLPPPSFHPPAQGRTVPLGHNGFKESD